MDIIENLEPQEDFQEKPQYVEEFPEKQEHITDVLVTQIILCIALVTTVFILNIFYPDISAFMIHSFKYHSNMEFSEFIKHILGWIYDRV